MLAVLYHNENVNRPIATYKSGPKKGQPRYAISRSKDNKLQPRAKPIKEQPTFGKNSRGIKEQICINYHIHSQNVIKTVIGFENTICVRMFILRLLAMQIL